MAGYILSELPDGMANNEKTLFPKMQIYTMFDFDKVVRYIHDYSPGLSEGIIRSVLYGLTDAMKSILPNGHSIKIDGLGVFSLSLGFDETQSEETTVSKKQKEKYRHVCAKGINFKVDLKLINDINKESTFERKKVGVKRYSKTESTLEQRKRKALQIIKNKGFMSLNDYAKENNLSRSAASRELKRITSDPTSCIVEHGGHSHKVWICKDKM